MATPTRQAPHAGQEAWIVYFGGERVAARVDSVSAGGRELAVRTGHGELLRFRLSGATARFVAAGDPHGPRLELAAP